VSEEVLNQEGTKSGDFDPRLVKAGVWLAFIVVLPLGAAGLALAKWGSAKVRINPWWGLLTCVVFLLGALVVVGVPDVAGWPGQALDSFSAGSYAAIFLVSGVWAPLLGFAAGFGWRLYAEWGETSFPWSGRRTKKMMKTIADKPLRNGYVTVGISREDGVSRVVLPPSSTNTGTLVLGATGAGKTRGVMSMLTDAISAGDPVVYVDLKGSQDVPMDLAGLAAKYGRPFWHFKLFDASTQPYVGPAPGGPASYNPAGYGDATRRKDLLIEALGSTNEYYSNITANYLLTAFLVLQAANLLEGRSAMAAILEVMEPNELLRTARKIPPSNTMRSRLVELVELEVKKASKDRDIASSLGSLRNYLSLLMNSIAGPFISSNGDVIDFSEVDRSGGVVVFSLSDMEYRKLAAQLGTLVIQDISTYIGVREGDLELKNKPFYLVVDEFSAFGRDNILGLLARGRSANVHTVLATQNLADLARAGDGFREQALGIVGSFVLFRGNTRADCEIMSGLTGKSEDGESGSTDEFVDWPEVQRLGTGECIVVNNMAAPVDMPKGFTAGRLERSLVVLRDIPAVQPTTIKLRVSNDSAGNWLAEAPIDGEVQHFLTEMSVPAESAKNVQGDDDAGERSFSNVIRDTSFEPPVGPVEPAEKVEFAEPVSPVEAVGPTVVDGLPEQPAPARKTRSKGVTEGEREPVGMSSPPVSEVRERAPKQERFTGIMQNVSGAKNETDSPNTDTPDVQKEGSKTLKPKGLASKTETQTPHTKGAADPVDEKNPDENSAEPSTRPPQKVDPPVEIKGRLGRNRGLQPPDAPPPRRPSGKPSS